MLLHACHVCLALSADKTDGYWSRVWRVSVGLRLAARRAACQRWVVPTAEEICRHITLLSVFVVKTKYLFCIKPYPIHDCFIYSGECLFFFVAFFAGCLCQVSGRKPTAVSYFLLFLILISIFSVCIGAHVHTWCLTIQSTWSWNWDYMLS